MLDDSLGLHSPDCEPVVQASPKVQHTNTLMKQLMILGLAALSPVLGIEALRRDASANFDEAGFSIDVLDEAPSDAPAQRLTMLLPPSDGFAPNVNVQTQPFTGTIEEYAAKSRGEIKGLGLELVEESIEGEDTWLCEYAGSLTDTPMHWFAKATVTGEFVYLATGTALESHWGDASAQLQECVSSLNVDQGGK